MGIPLTLTINFNTMKNLLYILTIVALCLFFYNAQAQDAAAKLTEAESAYDTHKLDDARFALQDAITAINITIGNEMLAALPDKMNDLAKNSQDDNVSSVGGFAGVSVIRSYGTDKKTAKVVILDDSPLLAGINSILSLPALVTGSNPDQKRIKVGGYKGLLNKSANSETKEVSYNIQVPVNQTLVTFEVKGFDAENDVVNMANTLPMDKIAQLAQ